jgi:hypothetical protein
LLPWRSAARSPRKVSRFSARRVQHHWNGGLLVEHVAGDPRRERRRADLRRRHELDGAFGLDVGQPHHGPLSQHGRRPPTCRERDDDRRGCTLHADRDRGGRTDDRGPRDVAHDADHADRGHDCARARGARRTPAPAIEEPVAASDATAGERLPDTASEMPLLALAGLMTLAAGLVLRELRRRDA